MPQQRKLQVFVSSTYMDLKQERQAAVEAILTAGHIPAGMELFSAGDESQLNTIRRWIDESDVFLLILGGRYGAVEPISQKSYTHLEYEYAAGMSKPLFAVVMDDKHLDEKIKIHGRQVMETEFPQKLKEFRALVVSKVVRFWSDPKDIKLAVLEKLAEFGDRKDLKGWIPARDAINTGAVAEELARLAKENADLRERITRSTASGSTYSGLSFHEFYLLLLRAPVTYWKDIKLIQQVAQAFGDESVGLLHVFWVMSEGLLRNVFIWENDTSLIQAAQALQTFGLIKYNEEESALLTGRVVYSLTQLGHEFLLRLRLEKLNAHADTFFLPFAEQE